MGCLTNIRQSVSLAAQAVTRKPDSGGKLDRWAGPGRSRELAYMAGALYRYMPIAASREATVAARVLTSYPTLSVVPAKAGSQGCKAAEVALDPRFRGGDV
jgi:hypothetical protein